MFIFLVQKCHTLLLLVLFSILLFGFLFFHVHHLCMPLLGPELVNKILVSCISFAVINIKFKQRGLYFYLEICSKAAEGIPCQTASLGLHCLQRPVCHCTR